MALLIYFLFLGGITAGLFFVGFATIAVPQLKGFPLTWLVAPPFAVAGEYLGGVAFAVLWPAFSGHANDSMTGAFAGSFAGGIAGAFLGLWLARAIFLRRR